MYFIFALALSLSACNWPLQKRNLMTDSVIDRVSLLQAEDGPSGAYEEDEYDALNDETFGAETGTSLCQLTRSRLIFNIVM